MRDLVILVADGTMRAVFEAFFRRERWDRRLQCASFDLWPQEDIINDPLYTDGGVHKSAHELLRPYLNTHRRAVVVLDQQFGGELPADIVRDQIQTNLTANGWANDRCAAIVIAPELEVWLWQDNPNVARAIGFEGPSLQAHFRDLGRWPVGATKPIAPKETLREFIKPQKAMKPKVVYSRIAGSVSVNGCTDPAFQLFAQTLRAWFPTEGV